jgi:hypothetical protein
MVLIPRWAYKHRKPFAIVKPLVRHRQRPYLFDRPNEIGPSRSRGAFVVLPAFSEDGDLPPGVYRATMTEVLERFGQGSIQRRAVADRLQRVYECVVATGQLARFIVFGSFVTAKDDPNDVDIVLVMLDTFDLASVTDESALVFQHPEANTRFGASIFWVTRSGAIGGEQTMIEYWQVRREGGQRGIVEIVPEMQS